MSFASVPELLEEIRAGRMVVVVDDEDRENEGDLIMAAELVRPADVTFMITHAPGLVCLSLTRERCAQLSLAPVVQANTRLLYTSRCVEEADAGLLDYDEVERLALEHKPKMVVSGFAAYAQVVDWARMREIADKVGAYLFVDMAHVAGLVAAGVYPNPLPHAHVVTSTTHKTLRGPRRCV